MVNIVQSLVTAPATKHQSSCDTGEPRTRAAYNHSEVWTVSWQHGEDRPWFSLSPGDSSVRAVLQCRERGGDSSVCFVIKPQLLFGFCQFTRKLERIYSVDTALMNAQHDGICCNLAAVSRYSEYIYLSIIGVGSASICVRFKSRQLT